MLVIQRDRKVYKEIHLPAGNFGVHPWENPAHHRGDVAPVPEITVALVCG